MIGFDFARFILFSYKVVDGRPAGSRVDAVSRFVFSNEQTCISALKLVMSVSYSKFRSLLSVSKASSRWSLTWLEWTTSSYFNLIWQSSFSRLVWSVRRSELCLREATLKRMTIDQYQVSIIKIFYECNILYGTITTITCTHR